MTAAEVVLVFLAGAITALMFVAAAAIILSYVDPDDDLVWSPTRGGLRALRDMWHDDPNDEWTP